MMRPTTEFRVPFGQLGKFMQPGECCTGGPPEYKEKFGHPWSHHPVVLLNNGWDNIWVDMGVANIVRKLWHRGIKTGGTCQGGGNPLKFEAYIAFAPLEAAEEVIALVQAELGIEEYSLDSDEYCETGHMASDGSIKDVLRWKPV